MKQDENEIDGMGLAKERRIQEELDAASDTPETDALRKKYRADTSKSEDEWKDVLFSALGEMERERNEWKRKSKNQWIALSQARHNAMLILNIRWGHYGDCGAVRLAAEIEEVCNAQMEAPNV